MMTLPSRDVGRIATGRSILLLIAAASLTVGCASVGWKSSSAPPLATGVSRAKVIPGNWERVEALKRGSPLVVTLKTGDRISGAFRALRSEALALTDPAGSPLSVARLEIGKIMAPGSRDNLTNGVLIGAGVGLGAAVTILAIVGSADGYVLPSAKRGAPLLLSSVGGVVGALIDRAHNRDQLLYLARSK